MVEVYVGAYNATGDYAGFFRRPGTNPDGNFRGEIERDAYHKALNHCEKQIKIGQAPNESKETTTRFKAYQQMLTHKCEVNDVAIPLVQALYEELTEFIESGRFEKVPPKMKQNIIGLQAELFSRLKQTKILKPSGTGTALEAPNTYNDTSQAFKARQAVLEAASRTAPRFSGTTCPADIGSAEDNEQGPEAASNGLNPFSNQKYVNTDARYSTHNSNPDSKTTRSREPGESAPPSGETHYI